MKFSKAVSEARSVEEFVALLDPLGVLKGMSDEDKDVVAEQVLRYVYAAEDWDSYSTRNAAFRAVLPKYRRAAQAVNKKLAHAIAAIDAAADKAAKVSQRGFLWHRDHVQERCTAATAVLVKALISEAHLKPRRTRRTRGQLLLDTVRLGLIGIFRESGLSAKQAHFRTGKIETRILSGTVKRNAFEETVSAYAQLEKRQRRQGHVFFELPRKR